MRGKARERLIAAIETGKPVVPGMETPAEFRAKLDDYNRKRFNSFTLKEQDRQRAIDQKYPESVDKDIPDPFAGPHRGSLWRFYYSTRASIRYRETA